MEVVSLKLEHFRKFYNDIFSDNTKTFLLDKADFLALNNRINDNSINYYEDAYYILKLENELGLNNISNKDFQSFKNTGLIYITFIPKEETTVLSWKWDGFQYINNDEFDKVHWYEVSEAELYYWYKLISFFEPLK